jgi:hypothetical protein
MLLKTSLLLALAAISASASSLTLNSVGLGSTVSVTGNGQTYNVFAGQLNLTVDGQSMIGFCVDLYAKIGYQSYTTVTGAPASYANGGQAAWIVQTYGPQVSTGMQAAALQLALWDVVHDAGNGLTAGNLVLNAAAGNSLLAAADAIVQASQGKSSTHATIFCNTSATGYHAQTLIAATNDVPEPSTVAMLTAGGTLVIVARLRRRRQRASGTKLPRA